MTDWKALVDAVEDAHGTPDRQRPAWWTPFAQLMPERVAAIWSDRHQQHGEVCDAELFDLDYHLWADR